MTPRIRLIVLAVSLACMLLISRQVRHRQMHAKYLVLWASLCLLALPLVAFPVSVDRVSEWLGIYYPPATLLLGATLILFLVSIHFSREISRLEERTRTLAEEVALLRAGDPPGDVERDGLPVDGARDGQGAGTREAVTPAAALAGSRTPDA